jgi:sugar lactone lactonase YvrE
MRYDMATGAVTTLLDSLHFANGVAMGPGGRYLLVSETGGYRVLRYWLAGDRAGRVEPFAENLPGFPDNITFDGRDRFWVAIVSPRNALMDRLAPWPAVRRSVARLPAALRPKPVAHAIVLAFDTTGRLVENLQDAGPGAYAPLTTVREADGWLYLGSLTGRAIGRIRAPDRR